MSIPIKTPSKTDPVKAMSQASVYGERAMAMMNSLRVLPIPQHYSVFFCLCSGSTG
jgi:hypothetical protein